MKRTALLLAILLPVAASFTSCKKDGVYNPKQKISRIYYAYSSPDPDFNSEKQLVELWNWDGKKLSSITYYDRSGEMEGTEKFTYDGKRFSRTDYVAADGRNVAYVLYSYDGRKLDKMEYYYLGKLAESNQYSYDGKKLSKIEVTYYDLFDDLTSQMAKQRHSLRSRMFRNTVPEAVCTSMDWIAETHMTTDMPFRQKGGYYTWTVNLTWDGKNVSKVEYYDPTNELISIQYSYDKNNSPFYGCYTMGIMDDEELNLNTSKNNVVSETWNDGYRADYSYQYDGSKFPTSKTVKWAGDEDSEIWYYEYK